MLMSRPMMISFLFILIIFCTLISYGCTYSTITIVSPLEANKLGNWTQEGIPHGNAWFGTPPYGKSLTGILAVLDNGHIDGCQTIDTRQQPSWPRSSPDSPSRPVFLMLDTTQATCDISHSAFNAQTAGASFVIFVSSYDEAWYPTDPQAVSQLTIPAIGIGANSARALRTAMSTYGNITMNIQWNLPAPDNHVEWELWTSSHDQDSILFKSSFYPAVAALSTSATFTPRYAYFDFSGRCEKLKKFGFCEKNCLNNGKYCSLDPDLAGSGLSGADVMRENLRQMCLYRVSQATINTSLLWWSYVNAYEITCKIPEKWIDPRCGEGIMIRLGINVDAVKACMNIAPYRNDSNNIHPILQAEYLAYPSLSSASAGFYLGTVFINTEPYHGTTNCPNPISRERCGVLNGICAGFLPGSEPDACTTSVDCPLTQHRDACGVCGGDGAIDACGICQSIRSPQFNSTCRGCDGRIHSGLKYDACHVCNGTGSLDACGRCLQAHDTLRIEIGQGGWDGCGQCLRYDHPQFNVTCFASKSPSSSSSGLSTAATIGISMAVVIVILIAVGIVIYTKRQRNASDQHITALLRAYVPMEDPSEASTHRSHRASTSTSSM